MRTYFLSTQFCRLTATKRQWNGGNLDRLLAILAKQLTKHGAEALGDVVADAIEGSDPSIKAKAHLAQARTDVSNAIRQNNAVKRKRTDISTEQRPVKKKKKKTGFKGKTKKEFNIFHNH